MTRHPVQARAAAARPARRAPVDDRGRVERPSRELRAEIFRRFLERARAAARRRQARRHPASSSRPTSCCKRVVLRLPRVGRGTSSAATTAAGRVPAPRLVTRATSCPDAVAARASAGLAHVIVDAPQVEAKNVPPTVLAVTAPLTYIRFHGRNAGTWNDRGGERLRALRLPLHARTSCASGSSRCASSPARPSRRFAVFNNNNRSPRPRRCAPVAQAPERAHAASGCSPSNLSARPSRRSRAARR